MPVHSIVPFLSYSTIRERKQHGLTNLAAPDQWVNVASELIASVFWGQFRRCNGVALGEGMLIG
ncbi:hypothetical protein D3C85_1604600 [compost metagenome]